MVQVSSNSIWDGKKCSRCCPILSQWQSKCFQTTTVQVLKVMGSPSQSEMIMPAVSRAADIVASNDGQWPALCGGCRHVHTSQQKCPCLSKKNAVLWLSMTYSGLPFAVGVNICMPDNTQAEKG
eukprot:1154015-Pelagomonas_calceolata.AAC.2